MHKTKRAEILISAIGIFLFVIPYLLDHDKAANQVGMGLIIILLMSLLMFYALKKFQFLRAIFKVKFGGTAAFIFGLLYFKDKSYITNPAIHVIAIVVLISNIIFLVNESNEYSE